MGVSLLLSCLRPTSSFSFPDRPARSLSPLSFTQASVMGKLMSKIQLEYIKMQSDNSQYVQLVSIHAQRSGDHCDVLANPIGMHKLENYVLFNLCIRAMKAAGIIFKPFVAEKKVFTIHVRLLGTNLS
jgi:hypothetical protein